MNDLSYPDESETLDTFKTAAASLGVRLTASDEDATWKISFPCKADQPSVIRWTGNPLFPYRLSMPERDNCTLLPACNQKEAILSFFSQLCQPSAARKEAPEPFQFQERRLSDWSIAPISAKDQVLTRKNQSRKGWPMQLQLCVTESLVIFETKILLDLHNQTCQRAVQRGISESANLLVNLDLISAENASWREAELRYRLCIPASMMNQEMIEPAIHIICESYQETAPAFQAMALEESLSAIFLLCQAKMQTPDPIPTFIKRRFLK